MSPSTVVTGAAGFIGGHLVETLRAAGRPVVGIDREPAPAHLAGATGLEWVRGDLTDTSGPVRAAIVGALAAAGAVLHLAGCPGVRDRAPDVDARRRRDNVDATAAVAAATPAATPLVVASSSSVYGGSRPGRPSVETDPVAPRGAYAASKVQAERLCARRSAAGGTVTVARLFTVAGERQRADMGLSSWIAAARAGLPLVLLGSPDRTRDITDVRQVAAALLALADRGATGTVNVGTGTARRLDELAGAVCSAVGRPVPRIVEPAASVEVRHTLAHTGRLAALVGWVPQTDLPALVARQAAAQVPVRPQPVGR